MKLELQRELFLRYPKFFRKPGKRHITGTAQPGAGPAECEGGGIGSSPARPEPSGPHEYLVDDARPFDERGVECDDGWFNITARLSHACEDEIDLLVAEGILKEGWPRVAQIKEKFGTLRFRVTGPISDSLRAQILEAETVESSRVCEHCGRPRQPNRDKPASLCESCQAQTNTRNRQPGSPWKWEGGQAALEALLAARP